MDFALTMAWILTTPMIKMKGANLKYDLHWLSQRGNMYCTNFVFDTTLVGSLLDENRSNGLDVHAKIYAPALGSYSDEFDKTVDKSRMDLVSKADLLPYAGGDADATLQVAAAQKAELIKDPALTSFYVNILHPAARAFEKVEQGGVCVDPDAYAELEADLNTELSTLVNQAKSILGGRLVAKHMDLDKIEGLNLGKASLLKDFMFTTSGLNLKPKMKTEKSGEPSTAMEHLLMFEDVPEAKAFVSLLKDYASASKTLQTYVIGFQKHLRSDGRYHPSYWFFAGNKDEGDGGTNCMPAGELVLTDRGYLPVQQVKPGYKVLTHEGRPQEVTHVVNNGVVPIVKVVLKNGLSLRTTANHAYRIGDGWVQAKDLVPGMNAVVHSNPEIWKSINGWEDFEVSTWGRVFNKKSGRMLTQYSKGKWGHLKVCLYRNGAQKRGLDRKDFTVHTLVADAFQTVNPDLEIRHKNGFAWDNTIENLGRGTSKENREDAVEHGSMVRRYNGQAKLTDEAVAFIRATPVATRKGGITNKQLAQEFGVCERLIRAVRSGRRWATQELKEKKATFREVQIVSIEWQAPEPTYGLTVAIDCSHVTGGVVTHNTGRLSCKDPAFQTVPKHTKWAKRLRKCYIAPPGFLVMERDYSQGELKIVACVANEPTMLASYQQGLDLHVVTGGNFAGFSYDEMMAMKKTDKDAFDKIRQLAKAGNFGLLYGMGEEGFMVYAISNYGVKDFTLAAAADFRNRFFQTYPGLLTYHATYKAFAKKHKYVRSPLGRIRHLPLIDSFNSQVRSGAERQSINSPIQSCLSDLMLWSMALEDKAGLTEACPAFGAIHDAAYNYVPEEQVDLYVPEHLEIMENLPFHLVGWEPQLKFTADAKVGKNMSDLKEWTGSHG